MRSAEPIRTCVGCSERAPQRALVRVVAAADGLALDQPGRRAPGRGAYLHAAPACWAAFARRRGPVRSLRRTPGVEERARLVEALAARTAPEVQR
jgi:predicted RNA-binding protein YlxR (DUF448 family)